MRLLISSLVAVLCLLVLYGCDSAALPSTPTPESSSSGLASPIEVTSVTVEATSAAVVSTWVPPTALVGTPIPGAEATLTAAPRLNRSAMSFENSKGETVNMTVEIANDEPSRELGLMFRASVPENEGMLFDFGSDTTSTFWMANTILPLSIAFIKADGTVLDIKDMQPLDQNTISASGPYRYALEANQGFFRAHNIVPGNHANLPGAQSLVIPGLPGCVK